MGLPNDTKFYWVCINEFREDTFWLKYFIDRAENTFEEKVHFLQALTGFTRDDQYMGKRLSSGKPFGSQSSGGIHSGSPTSGGNNSWGQTTNGQWAAQQMAAPPSAHQWSTPPNSSQWSTTTNAQQWSSPPVAPQWGSTSTAQQWSSPPVAPQCGTTSTTQPWSSPSNDQQWSSPPTNVQYGFSLETQTKNTRIVEKRVTEETPVPTSTNSQRGLSLTQMSRTRKSGGLFNIWGTHRGP
ncbi:hypothetical protein HID58_047362, partial [Brassica napus]